MPLIKTKLAGTLKQFIIQLNSVEQDNRDEAIDAFCTELENVIYAAVKSVTITIPTGAIQVQGSSFNQTNIAPIVLNKVVT